MNGEEKVVKACEMAVTVDDTEGGKPRVTTVSCHKEICTRTTWTDAQTALDHISKVITNPYSFKNIPM